jgi:hypothetical protein
LRFARVRFGTRVAKARAEMNNFARPLRALPLLVSAFALGLAGCASDSTDVTPPESGPVAVEMSDISILFPLPSKASEIDGLLPASATGARGTLFPEALYDKVGHLIGTHFDGPPNPGGVGEAQYSDLRVVAMRIDPCFAKLEPDPHGKGCTPQLRVIFQEVTASGGDVSAFDSALHVFFKLERQEMIDIARGLLTIRVDNTKKDERLGGLAPNAIILRQGFEGEFAKALRQTITQHAGEDNLTRVTQFSQNGEVFTWSFKGSDVSDAAKGTASPMVIPTLPNKAVSQVFGMGFTSGFEGVFEPPTISKDNLTKLANDTAAKKMSASARTAAFESLVRIENPGDDSPNTIDCASCHLATPAEKLVAKPHFSLVDTTAAGAFKANAKFVEANETAPTFDPKGAPNFHMFSYVGRQAGISQRTVNETAAIVAYLNSLPEN